MIETSFVSCKHAMSEIQIELFFTQNTDWTWANKKNWFFHLNWTEPGPKALERTHAILYDSAEWGFGFSTNIEQLATQFDVTPSRFLD